MLIEHAGPNKYLLGALEAAPEIFAYLLHELGDQEADFRPDADRFTLREVVAHLADWDAIFLARMRRTRGEDEPFLPDIDEGQLALDHDYARSNVHEQVQVLVERRAQLSEFARELSPHEWGRIGVHERAGRITLEALATLITLHDAYHMRQVAQYRELYSRKHPFAPAPVKYG